MKPYNQRLAEAHAYNIECEENMKNTPEPAGQKFPVGTRVRIADDLGQSMSHFRKGCEATVEYTYAHMFGGDDVKSYSLMFDNGESSCWYDEEQLTLA